MMSNHKKENKVRCLKEKTSSFIILLSTVCFFDLYRMLVNAIWFSANLIITLPKHKFQFVKGFGQDVSGEMYVATSMHLGPAGNIGKIYKLVAEKKWSFYKTIIECKL